MFGRLFWPFSHGPLAAKRLTCRDAGKFGIVVPRTTDSYRLSGDSYRDGPLSKVQGLGSRVWGEA